MLKIMGEFVLRVTLIKLQSTYRIINLFYFVNIEYRIIKFLLTFEKNDEIGDNKLYILKFVSSNSAD